MDRFNCFSRHVFFLLAIIVFGAALATTAAAADWTPLLDPSLSRWDTYLSYRHKPDYNGAQPLDDQGQPLAPIGYGKNVNQVFSTKDEQGSTVLRISGEIYGALISHEEYDNFRFRAKVKWGTRKWPPRLDKLRDSGILYFSTGPAGAEYWRTWMLAQEFQVMEGHMGDYWHQATSAEDIRAYLPEGVMNAVASETQPFLTFGPEPSVGGFCLRSENFESPPGEWTQLELICFEGRSLHLVNGHVVMVLRYSRYVKDGERVPLVKGKIQLQSEGAEVFFKDIEVQPIKVLPHEYQALFEK